MRVDRVLRIKQYLLVDVGSYKDHAAKTRVSMQPYLLRAEQMTSTRSGTPSRSSRRVDRWQGGAAGGSTGVQYASNLSSHKEPPSRPSRARSPCYILSFQRLEGHVVFVYSSAPFPKLPEEMHDSWARQAVVTGWIAMGYNNKMVISAEHHHQEDLRRIIGVRPADACRRPGAFR